MTRQRARQNGTAARALTAEDAHVGSAFLAAIFSRSA